MRGGTGIDMGKVRVRVAATDINKLVGREFDFYGVDNNYFKIDERVFEVLEDEGDGYRSSLGAVEARNNDGSLNFYKGNRIARVRLEAVSDYTQYHADYTHALGNFDGFLLRDVESGHIWLAFGTDRSDDWYPSFIFSYTPVWDAVIAKLKG